MTKIEELPLTNEAKYFASMMYKHYVEQRKKGVPRNEARYWGNVDDVLKLLDNRWSANDAMDICFELKQHDIITGMLGNNKIFRMEFTTEGISMLEVSFKDKVNAILDYANKIKNLIPFI